jgi:hypothetical protein
MRAGVKSKNLFRELRNSNRGTSKKGSVKGGQKDEELCEPRNFLCRGGFAFGGGSLCAFGSGRGRKCYRFEQNVSQRKTFAVL